MTSSPARSRHVAAAYSVLFMLAISGLCMTTGCLSESGAQSPPPRMQGSAGSVDMGQHTRDAGGDAGPVYAVGQRYETVAHAHRSQINAPTYWRKGWTRSERLRLVSHSFTQAPQALRLLFDRPVKQESFGIDFGPEHELEWFGDQVVLVKPKDRLVAGTHKLEIHGVSALDGTSLGEDAELVFEVEMTEEEAEREKEKREAAWTYSDHDLIRIDSSDSWYRREARPEFKFSSFEMLTDEELEMGVVFVQERELFGQTSRVPFPAVTRFAGTRKHRGHIVYDYLTRPAQDLMPGGRSYLHVNRRMDSPDYKLRESDRHGYWSSIEFVVLEKDFELDMKREETSILISSNHPISASALEACLRVSPKPRLMGVKLLQRRFMSAASGKWRYFLDLLPGMPGMTYTVDVAASCTSALGSKVRGKRRFEMTLEPSNVSWIKEYPDQLMVPSVWSPNAGVPMIVEADQIATKPFYPVLARRFGHLEIQAHKLTESEFARRHLEGKDFVPSTQGLELPGITSSKPSDESEEVVRYDFDLRPVLDARYRGVVMMGESHRHPVLVVTDLAITRQGHGYWVTRLSSGEPVEGAALSLWDSDTLPEPAYTVHTDADGFAAFAPEQTSGATFVTASLLGDVTYLEHPQREMYRESGHTIWSTHTVSDRGVYRPGDAMHLTGWVRLRHGQSFEAPEQGGSLRILVTGPKGESHECESTFSALGGWSCDVSLPDSAATGEYSAEIHFSSSQSHSVNHMTRLALEKTWRVERQAPPRFGVTLRELERDRLQTLVSRYAGAPIARAKLRYTISEKTSQITHPDHPGYLFGLEGEEVMLTREDALTDVDGISIVRLPKSKSPGVPRRTLVEVTARDIDGSVIAQRMNLVDHPAKSYGLRVEGEDSWTPFPPDPVRVDVMAMGKNGERVSTGRLNVELVYHAYRSAMKIGPDGRWMREYTRSEEVEASCVVSSAVSPSPCFFEPRHSSRYIVRVKRGTQTVAQTERYFYRSHHSDSAHSSQVELVSSQPYYIAGDRAQLLIKSPYIQGARAFVTMQGHADDRKQAHETLWQDVVPITSRSQVIEVPLDEGLIAQPVSVTVTVVQGRGSKGGKKRLWYPSSTHLSIWARAARHYAHSYGYTSVNELTWNPEIDGNRPVSWSKRVHFEIHARDADEKASLELSTSSAEVRPGERVEVSLRLEDASGAARSGEAIVMVVDEGALALSAHTVGVPAFEMMLGKVYSPMPVDARDRLTTPVEMGMKSNPGGGGMNPSGAMLGGWREEDVLTAHVERVLVDKTGVARFDFEAPERLSRYRVIALGTHGLASHHFARAQVALDVTKPLQVRPSLPSFVSQGDELHVRAMVMSNESGEVDVSLQSSAAVELVDPARRTRRVRVKANEPSWVSWKTRVGVGRSVELSFQASRPRSDIEDKVRVTLPVRITTQSPQTESNPWHAQIREQRLWRAQRTESLSRSGMKLKLDLDPFEVSDEQAELVLTFMRQPDDARNRMLQSLIVYPHGCGEQTSSKLHGVLAAAPLDEGTLSYLGIRVDLEEYARVGVERLESMFIPGQGMPLWPKKSASPWITAYATWALLRARRFYEGVVPEEFLSGMLDVLAREVRTSSWQRDPEMEAFAHWQLAMADRADLTRLDALYQQRDTLTRAASALLALALEASGQSERARTVLKRALGESTLSNNAIPYGSTRRALSMVLLAAARVGGVSRVELQELVGEVTRAQGNMTQSRAFAAVAIQAAYDAMGEVRKDRIDLMIGWDDEVKIVEALDEKPVEVRLPLEQMDRIMEDTLYLDAASRSLDHVYVDIELVAPLKGGSSTRWEQLSGERFYVMASGPEAGKPLGEEAIQVGDLVIVHHLISCQEGHQNLAITDPLPAGLEVVNMSLATTSRRERELVERLAKAHPVLQTWEESFGDRDHTEPIEVAHGIYLDRCEGIKSMSYLARAVAPGTFEAPATYMEYMYKEHYNARSHPDEPIVIEP